MRTRYEYLLLLCFGWTFVWSVGAGGGAGLGAGLRVRCLYGTDARTSVQVCGRTRALQHPYWSTFYTQ